MAGDSINVLYLTTSMGLGGADKQISLLSRELAAENMDVHVIALRPLGPMGRSLVDSAVKITSLEIDEKWRLAYKLPALLGRLLVDQPDIIHGHMYHSNVLGRTLSTLIPNSVSVSTVHSTYETRNDELPEVTIRERMYRTTDVLSDLTTFVSEASRQRYIDIKAVNETTSMVIYNGIDTAEFYRDPERRATIREDHDVDGTFVWLTVGRFTHAKDYPTLIRAFDRLTTPNSELWIIGKGPLKSEIEREIRERELTDQVKLLGTTDNVGGYMSAADGFVLSSQWEGFGLVIAEAMACELPVVATRCGGPEEIVVDEKIGYLCQAGNPTALAMGLERLMKHDPAEQKRMGKAGRREIVNRFDMSEIANQWRAVYEGLLNY